MKVGIYDPYLDDLGGGEKYMMTIAQCLSKSNDVTVFWDNKKDLDALLERFSLDLSRISIKKNIFSSNVGFLNRFFESRKYDAIVFLSDGSIPLVSAKLFIHIQQPLPNVSLSLKSKFKVKRVTKFICNSNFTKSYIDKTFGVKSTVLYPPVEIKAKKIKKEDVILTVGKFRYKNVPLDDFKKQKVMIDAFKDMVKKELKGWKFVIVTGYSKEHEEEFRHLEEEAKGFPIEFFLGKEGDEVWEIYSGAKIYWHAAGFGEDLDMHPEHAEHFGMSIAEAMGAGTVPVVFSAGGPREIVEDKKSGFLWNTLDDLEDKTMELIKDSNLLNKMSKGAIERAMKFTGDRFCRELLEIIK